MKTWVSAPFGAKGRQSLLRGVLALALLGVLVWALPIRRPGEQGPHHTEPAPALDPFEKAGVTELKEGQRGPAFRVATLDGGEATLDTWKGKVVILNFWATWCTPCTVEMPSLERIWRAYRDRGLVVVGVSVDRGAPRALIDPYLKHLDLTFPILVDPHMETANSWKVPGVPATFVIRPGGEVAGMVIGLREWDSKEMRALLDSLLSQAHAHGT